MLFGSFLVATDASLEVPPPCSGELRGHGPRDGDAKHRWTEGVWVRCHFISLLGGNGRALRPRSEALAPDGRREESLSRSAPTAASVGKVFYTQERFFFWGSPTEAWLLLGRSGGGEQSLGPFPSPASRGRLVVFFFFFLQMIQHERLDMMIEMWNEDRSPERARRPRLTHTHTRTATGSLHSGPSLQHPVKRTKENTSSGCATTST